jgi:Uma2 family endonuclease
VTCGPIDPVARSSDRVLIVEVLSPSNWKKTWDNVLRYTAIESLTEILVLHQSRIMAEVRR